MLQLVNVGQKSLGDYATIATRGLMEEIRRLAEPLAGRRVLHLSATAFGGGVAEINYALVPLMKDAGLDVEWRIIGGADEFFAVTKTIHNALQGNPEGLTAEQQEIFRRYKALNAEQLDDDYDFVIVHDPQPAGVIERFPDSDARWIWRCHIDLSHPNQQVLDFLVPWIRSYDAAVFHMPEYVPQAAALPRSFIWPPAIDPLTPKNMALWKTRPMVASHVGGIVAQVQDGETGWLVDPSSPEECARACLEILGDPAAARQRALRGKEYVRRNFLMPRLLRDWLVAFNLLAGNDTAGAEVATIGAPA